MHFCETMKTLYQIEPALPLGILLTGIGGGVACAVGATTGSIALAAFGAYSAFGAGALSLAAMKNPQAFAGIKATRDRLNTLPTKIVCSTLCLAAPLLSPPLFALALSQPAQTAQESARPQV